MKKICQREKYELIFLLLLFIYPIEIESYRKDKV